MCIPDAYSDDNTIAHPISNEPPRCESGCVNPYPELEQIAPSDYIATITPTYRWAQRTGAIAYAISVYDINGNPQYLQSFDSSVCTSEGLCYATPTMSLENDVTYVWYLTAFANGQWEPWKGPKVFAVSLPPPAPTLIGQEGLLDHWSGIYATPIYFWNTVPFAVYYTLAVFDLTDGGSLRFTATFLGAPSSYCYGATCTVSPSPFYPLDPPTSALLNGHTYAWYVAAATYGGYGPWSAPKIFTVSFQTAVTPTPGPSPTPTTAPTVASLIQELATYGITAYPEGADPIKYPNQGIAWQVAELQQVLDGVKKTASALSHYAHYINPTHTEEPTAVFRGVMSDFEVLHVVNGFKYKDPNGQPIPDDVESCNGTTNAGCTSIGQNATAFYGNFYTDLAIVEYTMTHELGHRFNYRSDVPPPGVQSVLSLVERMDSGEVVSDCGSPYVFPVPSMIATSTPGPTPTETLRPQLVMGENQLIPWTRGERGWGSGPAKVPGGSALISHFQQNPAFQPPSTRQHAVDEAAADMFLNWAYYNAITYGHTCGAAYPGDWLGFHNEDWRGMTSNMAIPGTPDDTRPGSKRWIWMDYTMRSIFQNHPNW